MKPADPIDAGRLTLALNDLRLPTIKILWPDFAARADKEGWPAARFLASLTEHEMAERANRRIRRNIEEARLPVGKTLDSFDFDAVPMVSKAQIMALAAGDSWLDQGANLMFFGPPGGGKSHVSIAVPDPRPRGNRLECGYQWPDEMIVARIRHQRAGAGSSLSSPWAAVPRASSKSESSPASRRRDDEPRTGLGRRE